MLPGCQNGHCQNEPFECICDETEKWTGDHCDERMKFHWVNSSAVCVQTEIHGIKHKL